MALSGRFVALLALGIVPIVYFDDPLALVGWVARSWCSLGGIDLALAGSPRQSRLTRELPTGCGSARPPPRRST
jgi:hypothetical protein